MAASRSQTFSYTTDGLNRLAKAVSGTTWGANFSYDAWGNLYSATGVTGTTYVAMTVNQTGINNKNQFTQGGYGYDVAGNVVNDGLASGCGTSGYQWNAEGLMSCANGTTYAYDGDGLRVKKSSGTLYWAGGVAESDTSGNFTSEYVFFGGARIARRDVATGNVYYYLSDHLGSSNVVTNATGVIQNESDFYPFGGERQITNNLTNQHFKFTGKERDAESGLDNYQFRYLNSSMGRWNSPDPSGLGFSDPENPQTYNLYSYVSNNPLTFTDPFGLSLEDFGIGDSILVGQVVPQCTGNCPGSVTQVDDHSMDPPPHQDPFLPHYGQQRDNSWTADPNQPAMRRILSNGYKPDPDDKSSWLGPTHECVAACRALTGLPPAVNWRRGPKVILHGRINPLIMQYTAIAAFDDNGHFLSTGNENSAILLGQSVVKGAGPATIDIIDQFPRSNTGPRPAQQRTLWFKGKPEIDRTNNSNSYYVILYPRGV